MSLGILSANEEEQYEEWGRGMQKHKHKFGFSYTCFNLIEFQCRMKFSAVDVMERRNLEEELACKKHIYNLIYSRKKIYDLIF